MAKLYNLARMTTLTTGAGTITLNAAVSSYLTFAQAGVNNGDVIDYAISDGSNREIGTGTYSSAGPTLTRSVTKSTNSNSPISLSGSAEVFISPRAETLNDASLLVTGTIDAARLPAASDTAIGAIEIAVQSEMEAGTDTVRAVVPGRQHYHPSAAKAWVAYTDSGTPSIGGSFNVSSITDNGVGDHTINFTTAFSSTNYAGAAMGRIDTIGGGNYSLIGIHRSAGALAVGAIRLVSNGTSFTAADYTFKTAVFYGDQ